MQATAAMWDLLAGTIEDAVLVVSELVTNAVRACPREELGLLLRVDDCTRPTILRIGVWDPDETVPSMPEADLMSEGGRGLFIVASLGTGHGVIRPKEGGKIVWADLALRKG